MSTQTAELPNTEAVSQAAEMGVYDSSGVKVLFGDLIKKQKTIVVFIRTNLLFVSLRIKCSFVHRFAQVISFVA